MKNIMTKIVYDSTLPVISKMLVVSTVLGCLPGLYMCINYEAFELVSNYYYINKAFKLSFGIFLIGPLFFCLVGLITSRVLRISLSFLNVFQIKLFNFINALNTYSDIIKVTKYFEILYKYSVEEKLNVLKFLNQQQSSVSNAPALSDNLLFDIAVNQSTMRDVKDTFTKHFPFKSS